MADRPQTIKEWATSPDSRIHEPTESLKKKGFPVFEPPLDFFNWVLNNIYKWIDYIEDLIGARGTLRFFHSSTTPRTQLPYELKPENKLSQIEVLKRENVLIGGVAASSNSGSVDVEGGQVSEGGLTYVGGNTVERSYNPSLSFSGKLSYEKGTIRFLKNPDDDFLNRGTTRALFRGSSGDFDSRDRLVIELMKIRITNGELVEGSFHASLGVNRNDDTWRRVLRNNQIFLIVSLNETKALASECVIWNLSELNDIRDDRVETINLIPKYKNLDLSLLNRDTDYYARVVKSYNVVSGVSKGSIISSGDFSFTEPDVEVAGDSYSYNSETLDKNAIEVADTTNDYILSLSPYSELPVFNFFVRADGSNSYIVTLSLFLGKETGRLYLSLFASTLSLTPLAENFNRDLADALFNSNQVYFILSPAPFDDANGECIIWDLTKAYKNNRQFNGDYDVLANVDPIYKGVSVQECIEDQTFFRTVQGFSQSSEISGVDWNLKDYRYEDGKVKIELTPTQTNKALFHTFKIRQGGSDMLSLNSSDAEFASGVWTWSVPADPITETGIYEFVFQTTGSGFPAIGFTKINTGLNIETYNGVNYLHISSGVSNNDEILVRKV